MDRTIQLADEFSRHWSIETLVKDHSNDEPPLTYKVALDLLTSPKALEYLDTQSKLVETLYSRMPKYLAAQKIMRRMATATSATEASAVINAFVKWFDSAPPPSDRSFIEKLAEQLSK